MLKKIGLLGAALLVLGAISVPFASAGVPKIVVAEHFGDCC